MFALAGIITFVFTTILTIAGVGAAFILIPVFTSLGIDLRVAMATALLLNAIAMAIASARFIPARLVEFRTAVPILIVATVLSPLGAYASQFVPVTVLKWLFVAFLLFAASMMVFYRARQQERSPSTTTLLGYGLAVGGAAGFIGGMLGVGGGNFIVPVLVWLGFDPKKASATTAFIVVFSSLSGFLGHTSLQGIQAALLVWTAVGAVLGAGLGSYLMQARLQSAQVKLVIGLILYLIALSMIWKLVSG